MNIVRSDYMSKKRIYEYAKELNVKSKEIIESLGKEERVNVGVTDSGFAKKLMSMIDEYCKE
ncbi:hypothetical protein BUE67_15725 [Corynebacterium diphtheriae]|nr:hypothetical protein BUE67_15725 [Corynebacterium diphtheriae]